jgi:hypothetical protein
MFLYVYDLFHILLSCDKIMDPWNVWFFCGEGPRSRRYGRTAALRLLAQPCDENDDDYIYDYDYFLSFS